MSSALVIGYGNPGRLDDGLGPAFAEAVEKLAIDGVTVDSDYQLMIEDSLAVLDHDLTLFADADVSGPEPFYVRKIVPGDYASFSTHSIRPQALLALTSKLFEKDVDAYVLGIRGYEFNEFGEGLSERAADNLAEAVKAIEPMLRGKRIREIRADRVAEVKIDD